MILELCPGDLNSRQAAQRHDSAVILRRTTSELTRVREGAEPRSPPATPPSPPLFPPLPPSPRGSGLLRMVVLEKPQRLLTL